MLQETEKKVIRALQEDFPLTAEPYREIAARLGMPEEELLAVLRQLKEEGKLRRVGAILEHRKAGFMANGLCAWQVADEKKDELGRALSTEAAVSHCYCRKPDEGWPYNFYVMLHAATRAECEAMATGLSRKYALGEYRMLYSVREWKKATMKYFLE